MNLFGKKKKEAPKLSDSIQQLREAMNLLEKREVHLGKQLEQAHEAAKQKAKMKDKRGALFHLKRKKMYEKQVDQIYGKKHNIEMQIMALESAASNKELLNVMKQGKVALQSAIKDDDVENVADVMDDINESLQLSEELSEAMAQPMGPVMDEDELNQEFQELQDSLEEEEALETPSLVTPVISATDKNIAVAPKAPAGPIKVKPETPDEKEARELRELENIMNA